MRLAAGMEHRPFATPDAAIRSIEHSPLDAKAIDLGHVGAGATGPWEYAARIDRDATVRAILGRFTADEQAMLRAYAMGMSYADMARNLRLRKASCILRHKQAWRVFAARLQAHGLLEKPTS